MKFLKLYSPLGVSIGAITNYSDLTFTYGVDEISTLSFNISGYNSISADILCEGVIETDSDKYIIKEVSRSNDNELSVYATQDVDQLKGSLVRSYSVSNVTVDVALTSALEAPFAVSGGTQCGDWTISLQTTISRKRSISLTFTTVWDILQKIKDVYHIELQFNCKNKIIYVYNYHGLGKTLSEQGNAPLYFYDDINVSEIDLEYDTNDFANIVYGYGRKQTTETVTINYSATSSKDGKTTYYSDADKTNKVAYKYTTTKDGETVTCLQKIVSGSDNDIFYYARTTTSGETIKQVKISVDSKNKTIKVKTTTEFTIGIADASDETMSGDIVNYSSAVVVGNNCIWDYSYSNNKVRYYLYDEAYNDADALAEDCAYYLREHHQPAVSFKAGIVDFSKINNDYRSIGIGDTIRIKSRSKDLSISYRVVSMTVYDDRPEETQLELSSRRKTLSDSQAIQRRFLKDNTDSSGNVKSLGNNAVSSSSIGLSTINGNNYSVIDASDIVGTIDGNTIDVSNIIADNITSGTLDANSIDVVNLDASNITTGTLDASKANIINLSADAISTESLKSAVIEAGALTADTIGTVELSASQITSGEIDATNINIKNINGNNINDGTILAEALAEEVITNLQGTTVYYQAEAPTGTIKEGSLWYKTVTETEGGVDTTKYIYKYESGSWVQKLLDASTFTAGSITSREISSEYVYGGTMYADQIAVSSDIDKNKFSGFTISSDAIYRNNAGLGVEGAGNIYIGKDGFSVSDQIVYNASTDKVVFGDNVSLSWGNITGTDNVITSSDLSTSGGTVINANNITTGTISASRISGGTLVATTTLDIETNTEDSIIEMKAYNGQYKTSLAPDGLLTYYGGATCKVYSDEDHSGSGTIDSSTGSVYIGQGGTDNLYCYDLHASGLLYEQGQLLSSKYAVTGHKHDQIWYGSKMDIALTYESSSDNYYFRPELDNCTYLGGSTHRWTTVYAKNGSINTSDRNQKNSIEPIEDKYLLLYDKLQPVQFKFNDGDRIHTGFISQDIESAMSEVGLSDTDFAGFCKDLKEDGTGDYTYGLRYSEFIALNTAKIKQLEKQVQKQQELIDALTAKLDAMEV